MILNAAAAILFPYLFFRWGSVNKKMPRWTWGWEISLQSARGIASLHSGCSNFQLKREIQRSCSQTEEYTWCLALPQMIYRSKHKMSVWFWTLLPQTFAFELHSQRLNMYIWHGYLRLLSALGGVFFRHLWSVGNSEKNQLTIDVLKDYDCTGWKWNKFSSLFIVYESAEQKSICFSQNK